MDLIADLAFPLPFVVISEMLGIPEGRDRNQLREWSGAVVKTFDPILTREEQLAAFDAIDNIIAYVNETIDWKRSNPGDDLLTALIAAEDEGDRLSAEELVEQVMLLYVAGHETTVNLIGNGTLALLRDRAQLELLQADPSLDANLPDELLRFDGPVQMSRRVTLAPYEIDDRAIEPGTVLMTCLGSANRDPLRWGDTADRLDLRRADSNQHMSFGGGVPLVPRRAPRAPRSAGRDRHARAPLPRARPRDRHTRVERPHRAPRPDEPAADHRMRAAKPPYSGLAGAVGPAAFFGREPAARGERAAVGVHGRAGHEARRGPTRGTARLRRCRTAVPNRPIGTHAGIMCSSSAPTQREYGTCSVSVTSGAIALTRIP